MRIQPILLFLSLLTFITLAQSPKNYNDLNITCVTPEVTDCSTVYLFSHGFDFRKTTGIRQAKEYIKNGIINGMCYTFNYSDSFSHANFGQEDDYNRLALAYTHVTEQHPDADIVLVGLSRGSVAVLHFLATHETEQLTQIKKVMLESPFDTFDHVLEHIMKSYCWFIPYGGRLLKKIVGKFPNYKPHGLQGIDYAQQISGNIPFLISYSLKDKLVPPHATQTIITTLEKNKNNVTVVELEKGKHSTASFRKEFQDTALTFLKSQVTITVN